MKKTFTVLMMAFTMATAAFATTNAEKQFEGSFKDYAAMAAFNGLKNGTNAAVDESYFSVAPFYVPEFDFNMPTTSKLIKMNAYQNVERFECNFVKLTDWSGNVTYTWEL
jgi:hypothetical protein